MKRGIILVLFILLAFNISALEIQTEKNEFMQGETFFATLQGNILEDVTEEDIGFYEAHIQLPIEFDLLKIDNKYYVSAILPYFEKNLSLRIKDVYYKEQNKVQTNTIIKNFTISTELADFNIWAISFH